MEKNDLYVLLQNSAVGAISMHSFTLGYHSVAKNKQTLFSFPPLVYTFYVLPIVYNYEAMEVFRSSIELYKVLQKNNSINLGLQERAYKMAQQTFNSLNMAFSKEVLSFNKTNKTVELCDGFKSKKLPLPLSMNSNDNSVKKFKIAHSGSVESLPNEILKISNLN